MLIENATSGAGDIKVKIGTIITRNRAPAARVLAQSVSKYHPELRLEVLLVDHELYSLDASAEPFDVLTPHGIGIEQRELHQRAAIFNELQLCTSLKPQLLLYLLSSGAEAALFLDSDIELFSRVDDLFHLARSQSILLSPKITEPPPRDERFPTELHFLQKGVYNSGLVGAGIGGEPFLTCWAHQMRRRYTLGLDEEATGVDRLLDFVACLVDHATARDPGCNVAWWNLGSRRIDRDRNGTYRVNGSPLRFFHYSSFDPEAVHLLYRFGGWNPPLPHRARVASRHPEIATLCRQYAEQLFASGYRDDASIPYGFNITAGGFPLGARIRRLYRDALLNDTVNDVELPDPFAKTDASRFVEWLRTPARGTVGVSRYLKSVYDERPDLQSAFPDLAGDDSARYLNWVRMDGRADPPIPIALIPDEAPTGAQPSSSASWRGSRAGEGWERSTVLQGVSTPLLKLRNKIAPRRPGGYGRRGRAVVLLYHRVAELECDPWGLAVTPARFAEHVGMIREYFHPIALAELAHAIAAGDVPDRSVALTFDDGYRDNLVNAKPLLERFAIPATVFIVSGVLDSGRGFWWDALEEICLRAHPVPDRFEFYVGATRLEWDLGGTAGRCDIEKWRIGEEPPSARHALYCSLWEQLRPLAHEQRTEVLDAIRDAAGIKEVPPTLLASEDLPTLAEGGLVEIGAHTVTHPVLSELPLGLQLEEIRDSKETLEQRIGQRVLGFAYPFGEFNSKTVECVQQAGLTHAATTVEEPVTSASDTFALPRVEVSDWSGEELARRLTGLLQD